MEHLDNICTKLNLHELEKVQALKDLHLKTGVKPAYFGLGAIAIAAFFALLGYGGTWLSFLVGFLYPAYMSFKAIESKEDSDDDKQWLTYWVVFGFMHVFDWLIDVVISIIPFHTVLKTLFYIWLFHPKTKGALTLYNKFIKDLLSKYESKIDEQLDGLKKKIEESQPALQNAVKDMKREAVNRVIS